METLVKIIIGLSIFACVFLLVDYFFAKTSILYGIIVDKQYKPEESTTGVGTGIGADGTATTVVTTSNSDETFIIMAKHSTGKIHTIECEPELYYSKKIGETIKFESYSGLFTGQIYFNEGVE